MDVIVSTGRTVHVVPGEHGTWNVVDFGRRGVSFPTKSAAVDFRRRILRLLTSQAKSFSSMRSGEWNQSRITSCRFTKFLIMARPRTVALSLKPQ